MLSTGKDSSISGNMYTMVPQQVQQQQQQQSQQIHFQQQQQRIKQQQQQLMQQALIQPQMYHPGLLTTLSQLPAIEPIPSGNLPPGFDATSCRSVYVGNIHSKVTEALLADIFGTTGPLESCKLIKKEKSSYGFIDYYDHRAAASALLQLNGKVLFGQAIKVNWAYASGQREDTTGHFNIFVGDLSPEVTDSTLFQAFRIYVSCSDCRVMWDQKSGRSRGFGFVSFRSQEDAERAIKEMNGKWLGSRQIRCNWATKTVTLPGEGGHGKDSPASDPLSHTAGTAGVEQETGEKPEDNPSYTTVYVGNLAHEVTQTELHRQFHALSVGLIEDVRVQRDKGFGFVRFMDHKSAALAIQAANGRVICGKSVKCSWGSKPSPVGVTATPLPPPPPTTTTTTTTAMATFPGIMAAASLGQNYHNFVAYQRQLGLGGTGSSRGIIPLPQAQTLQGMQIGISVPAVGVSMPLAGMNIGMGQMGQHGLAVAAGSAGAFDYQLPQGRTPVASPGISQQRLYY